MPTVYTVAAVRVLFPLIVLPVMAARLGAEEFGRLGLCLIWATLFALVVEGGFLASATRQAVVADAERRRYLAQRVFTARCVLSLPVGLLAVGVGLWVIPVAGASTVDRWETAGLMAILACAIGWPATWYLQATSQLHRWAWVELTVHVSFLVTCLLLAHSVVAYLLLQSLAASMLAFLGWRWVGRDLGRAAVAEPLAAPRRHAPPFTLWRWAELRAGLALASSMLPVSLIGSVYTFGLPALAANHLGRSELGMYYLADRVIRSLVGATDPLMQLVYPRIVERFALSARSALRYAARWALGGFGLSLAVVATGWLAWPVLVVFIQGVDTVSLRLVLEILAWLLPMAMGWRFIGYWMLGSGRYDRSFRGAIVLGALTGLAGAFWLVDGARSLAAVALAAEVVVLLASVAGMLLTEWLRRR